MKGRPSILRGLTFQGKFTAAVSRLLLKYIEKHDGQYTADSCAYAVILPYFI